VRRWWLGNSVGFVVAYLLYSHIAHGFTGPHEATLSAAQLVSHSIAVLVAVLLVTWAQLVALRRTVRANLRRVALTAVVFVSAFWFGWFVIGAPADFFLAYAVTAIAAWVEPTFLRWPRILKVLLVLVATLFGTFVGMGLYFTLAGAGVVTIDVMNGTVWQHTIFWLFAGGSTGILGGLLSGLVLASLPIRHGGGDQNQL